MGEGLTSFGEKKDVLGRTEDLANESAVGLHLALPKDRLHENFILPSQKEYYENDESVIQKIQKHTTNAKTTNLSCKECPFRSKYKKILRQHSLDVHNLKQLTSLTFEKEKVCPDESESENEIKTTNIFETEEDPGADFEIVYEESFLGSTTGSFEAASDMCFFLLL